MEAPDMGVGAEIALNLWGPIGDYALLETGPLPGPVVAVTLSDLCHRRWGGGCQEEEDGVRELTTDPA